eukprot:TRINITY_DN57857_c0_g1_i1.p1 TRINITY_DN57857_c0_g1~~TRINITY_DN57857_c0_g1_i1.p1  ORF type:complete len:681 (+),score=103.35 TRINITY_DN57857_c0_g1_i1:156-2045(+)
MPALVGEIATGMIMGPHVLNVVPHAPALIVQGELALVLLMIEAGLHVDMEMIKIVGLRALVVGVLGSCLPMGLGMLVAVTALKMDFLEAFGVGAALATMSTGIALNVLKAEGVLNQPIGQLIIAAATVNELFNISLITEIHAIGEHGTWQSYVIPLVIMFFLVLVIGVVAITVVPCVLDKFVLPRLEKQHREAVVLVFIFIATLLFMPLCKMTGSSELLGAFLAGFCFCTDEHVHHIWHRQVKRVAAFLMRFFFACSIGFTVPVQQFENGEVWRMAGLLLLCISGKISMGLFAVPLHKDNFMTLGFSWGAWGEFSFILALRAKSVGIINITSYSALVLSVLISILVCPTVVRCALARTAKRAARQIAQAKSDTDVTETGKIHNVYYCLQTRSRATWGEQGNLLSEINEVGCKIIDFRSFHPVHDIGAQHVVNELYLKDTILALALQERLSDLDQAQLDERIREIMDRVSDALHDDEPEIKMSRWLPGPGTTEMIAEAHRGGSGCNHAPAALNSSDRLPSLEQLASEAAHRRLQRLTRKHQSHIFQAFDEHGFPGTPRAHHELDGFVHTDYHDAFDRASLSRSPRAEGQDQDDDSELDERDDDSDMESSVSNSDLESDMEMVRMRQMVKN